MIPFKENRPANLSSLCLEGGDLRPSRRRKDEEEAEEASSQKILLHELRQLAEHLDSGALPGNKLQGVAVRGRLNLR